jgi:hypothetical protein
MYRNAVILILLLLLGSGGNLFSQELSHQVLVPLAGVNSTETINYSQTVGETAVEIFSSQDFIFTQGFQQPGLKLIKVNKPQGNGVKVYPNPVTDILNVELFGDGSRGFRIDLINISGTIVNTERMVFTDPFWQIQQLSVSQLSKGLYFVRIVSNDGLISRTFKIDKM